MLLVFIVTKQTYRRTGIQRAASDLVEEMDKYEILTIFASYGPLLKKLSK
jgi:hypothetical protein